MQIFSRFFLKFLKNCVNNLKKMRGSQWVARGACSVHICRAGTHAEHAILTHCPLHLTLDP